MEVKEKVEDAVDSFLLFWGFAWLIGAMSAWRELSCWLRIRVPRVSQAALGQ